MGPSSKLQYPYLLHLSTSSVASLVAQMDVDRPSMPTSDFGGFGLLKNESVELLPPQTSGSYGYDFAEVYLNMIEPTCVTFSPAGLYFGLLKPNFFEFFLSN